MKILYINLFIFFLLFKFVYSQPPEVIWVLSSTGSAVLFLYSGGDEFNGTTLDLNKWYTHGGLHNRKCSGELQYYLDQNIEVSNGTLKLIAKQETVFGKPIDYEPENYMIDCGGGTSVQNNSQEWDYTSGTVTYKHPFKMDLVEVRLRLPNEGQGLWPAIWQHEGTGGEIDFIEGKGEKPTEIHICVHYPNGTMWSGGWEDLGCNLTNLMRNYTFIWLPGLVRWNFENQSVHTHHHFIGQVLTQRQYLFINLAIAGDCDDCSFRPGPNSSTEFPATFEIDFVRIYTALYDQNAVIELCNYQQSPTDLSVITGNEIIMGGDNDCSVLIKDNEYITLVALESIKLKKGFHAQAGSNFKAYSVNLYDKGINNFTKKQSMSSLNYSMETEQVEQYYENINNQVTSIKIFPNPTTGLITLVIDGDYNQILNISILTSTSNNVYNSDNIKKMNTINISHLPKGLYFLKITCIKEVLTNIIILQ